MRRPGRSLRAPPYRLSCDRINISSFITMQDQARWQELMAHLAPVCRALTEGLAAKVEGDSGVVQSSAGVPHADCDAALPHVYDHSQLQPYRRMRRSAHGSPVQVSRGPGAARVRRVPAPVRLERGEDARFHRHALFQLSGQLSHLVARWLSDPRVATSEIPAYHQP